MKKFKLLIGVFLSIAYTGCNNTGNQQGNQQLKLGGNMEQQEITIQIPKADKWVQSPLRNRLTLKLSATADNVWELVGDPANMPQYSEGLNKVETEFDDKGNCTGYTCYFKPIEGEQKGIEHFSKVTWHEKSTGWASLDADENPFGTTQSLSLMTLEGAGDSTVFKWDFHYNCADENTLDANKESYYIALNDISLRLINRFGGTQLENYVEGK